MFETVISVCQNHQPTWQNTPAFNDLFSQLTVKVDLLKTLSLAQITDSKGITVSKALVLDNLVENAAILCSLLGAYALEIGDTELLTRNLFSPSEWRRGNALLRINRFQRLLADGQTHEMGLVPYGVDTAFLQDFEAKLDAYTQLIQQPRLAIIEHKNTTLEIKRVMNEVEAILNEKMDRVIRVFAPTDPRFVSKYKDARSILDLKGKRRKPQNSDATEQPEEPDDGVE